MIYQIVITAGLALFLVNLVLNLVFLKRPDRRSRVPKQAPLVSVMVPARNEEDNIGACLESLRKQDYPNFEVLVLDDSSVDGTPGIVQELAAKDEHIRLFYGEPLPKGWAGKPFACHQLAQQARGDWLLFVDADTTHAPHMLRSVLSLAMKLKVSLLSGFPRQLTGSFPQKITVPLIYFIILGWAPLWLIHRLRKPRPSVAIGQFLLFSRGGYEEIGGHEAVKQRILDDIWLGIEVSRHGGRHVAIDLSSVVSCDMYPTPAAMWHGLVRCVYSVASMTPFMLLGLILVAGFYYIGPFYWAWDGFLVSQQPFIWRTLIVSQISVIFFMHLLVDTRFKSSAISTWLHLLGLAYIFVIVLYSMWRWATGAGVTWKERAYGKEESIIK